MERKPDIVRIDEFGVARPVDRQTIARFKGGKGSYRLLPSPPRFVLLEKIVETEANKPLHLRLSGEIGAPGMMCDVVGLIAQAGWRGELVVWSTGVGTEPIARSVFLENGNVLGAQSNAPGERLGELMYRLGVLDKEQIAEVAKKVTPERRFGETAIDLGFLRRERLYEMVRLQAEETFFAAMRTSEGTFWFLDGFDPSRLAYRNHVSAQLLLMEAVRRLDEARYFAERIPSTAHVPVPLPTRAEPPMDLRGVFASIDGLRSVAEVGRACGLPDFETLHSVFQLVQGGFVQITSPRPTSAEAVVEIHNEAVRRILEAADAAGRGKEVRERLAAFASGVGVYDAIFLGAGPRADGTLDAARVARNLELVGEDDPTRALAQWLHDYLAFALFDATTEMPRSRAAEVNELVAERIALLAPKNAPSSVHPPAMLKSRPASVPSAPATPGVPDAPPTPPPETRPSGMPDVPPVLAMSSMLSGPPPPPNPALQPAWTPGPITRPSLGVPVPAPMKATQVDVAPLAGLFEKAPSDPPPTPLVSRVSEPPSRLTLTPQRRRTVRATLTAIAVALLLGAAVGTVFVLGLLPKRKAEPVAIEKAPAVPKPQVPPAAEVPKSKPPEPEPAASAPAIAATTEPSASAPASSSPPVVASSSAPPVIVGLGPTQGRLKTDKAPGGFRVFVDNRVAGNTPEPIVVPCGAHVVKVGSHGTPQNLFVPCGGELDVLPR